MAKGQTIGLLNFGMGGDDTELQKIFAKQKKQAEELQALYKSIGFGNGKEQAAAYKMAMAERRKESLAQARLDEIKRASDERAIINQQRLSTETKKTNTEAQKEKLALLKVEEQLRSSEQHSIVNQKRIAAESQKVEQAKLKTSLLQAKVFDLNKQSEQRSLLFQQRLLTEVQRTEAAKKRAALVGVQGQRDYANALGLTNKTMFSQYNLLQQLSAAAGIYFSIYQAGAFVKELAMVSGEFEKQRLSLAAIIQDQEAATKIFNQIKDLSVYSPFNFKELTDYAKQLSAFSIPTNEIFDTMKRLADISAGLGVDMNRIILAYGQVRSASVLRGQELRQFTEAGIPLVDELAKKFTELSGEVVKAGDVFDKISNREVPFAMIKEIFEDLTSEGGKFFNMQEIQAKSLAGMISNLRDAYDIMLDSIGQANSDLMKGAVGGLTDIMNNWKAYWDILKGIILTFGTYKAVLIASSVAQKGLAIATMVQRFLELTKTVRASTAALAALNMIGLTTPIGAIAALVAAIAGLGYGVYKLSTYTTDLEDAQKDLQTSFAQEELTLVLLTNRLKNATAGTKEYETAKNALNSKYGDYLKNLNLETDALITSKEAYAALTAEIQKNASERLYAQYTEEASTNAGEKIGKEYSKIIKQLKSDVGELNYSDVLSSVKSVLSNSSSSYEDVIAEFRKSGLDFEKYWRSVNAIYIEQKKLSEKVIEFQNIFSTTGTASVKTGEVNDISQWAKNINAAVSSLNISDELKRKFKISDETKDFSTLRKETIGYIEELDEKLKERKAAPSIFRPDDIEAMQKELDAYLAYVNILGGIEEKKKPEKDFATEKLKDQVDLIKSAKSEYEKLLKIMDADKAKSAINDSDAYKGVDVKFLSDEGYTSVILETIEELKKRGTDEAKNLALTLQKEIFGINAEKATEDFKKAFEEIEKYLSDYRDKYSLYKQIFDITGNKDGAVRIAFGDSTSEIKTYTEILKEQMSLLPEASDEWKKLNEQLEATNRSDRIAFSKEMADLVAKYQDSESKITAIKKQEEARRIDILANADGASDEIIQQRLDANRRAAQESINEVESTSLKLTEFYQHLFGSLGDYGDRTLGLIISKTNQLLNTLQSAQKNSTGLYEVEIDGKKVTLSENDLAGIIKQLGKVEKEASSRNPFKALVGSIKEYKKATTDEAKSTALDNIGMKISSAGEAAQQLGSDISNMFSAFGADEMADTVGFIGEMAGSLATLGEGIASKDPVKIIKGIVGAITSVARHHDRVLDRAIQNSQLEVKKLESAYADLERVINRQLGSLTQKQYKQQLDNLKKQREELYKQRQAEEDKKKTDKQAVIDYNDQISELSDTIKYFAEDLAKELYGIDIFSWSSELSSAIVDAFASGEDAAKAFDDTVADIMRNVAKSIISLEVIEPAMQKVRDYLFGDRGVLSDGNLSESDAQGLAKQLAGLKDSIGEGKKIWDILNEAAKDAGVDLSNSSKKKTLGASIQSLTENTGNLVASYLNAMRADLSYQRKMVEEIRNAVISDITVFANIHAKLVEIEANTRRTADSNDSIKTSVEETFKLLKSATSVGSTVRLNIR